MNIPGITRALELDDADWDLAVKLRGLTEHQREQFSAALGPVKAQKKAERVIEHCAACDYTQRAKVHKDTSTDGYHEFQPSSKKSAAGGGRRSTRGESLKQQISGRAQSLVQPPAAATTDDTDDSTHTRCQFTRADGKLCLLLPDHNIHHMKTANEYHEFVAGKSDAQSAAGGS